MGTKSSKTGTNSVKQVLNSVKLRSKPMETQSNGRLNLNNCINQPGTLKTGCVHTPLGSPTRCPKRSYVRARGVPVRWSSRAVRVGGLGGYTGVVPGWVYWEGYTGVLPSHCSRGANPAAKRAPEAHRAGVGGRVQRACYGDGGGVGPGYHPAGPVGLLRSPPCTQDLGNAASQPIRARFRQFSIKLVKTAECRPNMSKRPVIVPILKMSSESHLLKFPDFHISQPSLTRN